ncbi:TPA: ABC transporter ATP-binding protein [Streptococcus suis]|uniref:ABC transporter ATP-binding protein n=1 Tax=Streptococcus suis TaxID=1307 RepID=A0AAW5LUN0_STRSU|nr:ABC transporter ATP-binding protein [Streptococcus suis]MBS8085921.1 ABC transporter ATP-binding protein [Streptococcus suis]MCO8220190.1 ABC transporter ATP-binding protein [Streptococcus suis]MCR1233062.1 ABC transporter ATP-binding protein [Streptococcus suis]NQI88562.1 ABC transporter ATP-binding protein [Streptococcus suis]NQI92143.1 ABC transporter ATP-binding protein [Streptococcus suis]
MSETIIKTNNLTATVPLKDGSLLTTVNRVNLDLKTGCSYAIVGKSGSGKTSLISILGLLNASFQGQYYYQGKDVSQLSDRELSDLRSQKIGFVFQNYSLIKHLKVWENIDLSLVYAKKKIGMKKRMEVIQKALSDVGLDSKQHYYPSDLSGGEQQRVAIARALVIEPQVIICDEPTGALDKQTGKQVMDLLQAIIKKHNTILILVTHDPDLAQLCDIVLQMDEGEIIHVSNDT